MPTTGRSSVPIARTHDTLGSLFVTAERLSARSADGSGASLRRRRPCRARQVAASPMPLDADSHRSPRVCASGADRRARPRRAAAGPAHAWVYPEHRDIAVLAVEKLDAERKALFDRLWSEARAGHEQRLCEQAADAQQGRRAGLHRLGRVHGDRRRPFVLEQEHARQRARDRLDPAGRRRGGAAEGGPRADRGHGAAGSAACGTRAWSATSSAWSKTRPCARERVNALRTVRHAAATRRPAVRHPRRLEQRALPAAAAAHRHHAARVRRARAQRPGRRSAPIGVYAWFHLSALQKATRLANEPLAPAERQALARAMLADEGFALHFLRGHASPPAMSPAPGATCRSARARTTTTTSPAWRSSPGAAAANRWC